MSSIWWTYTWTLAAMIGALVRTAVIRQNIAVLRLIDGRPEVSKLMRSIARGHLRVSIMLSIISITNFAVGIFALVLRHHPSARLASFVGYFFIVFLISSELILSLLAWWDLRTRGTTP